MVAPFAGEATRQRSRATLRMPSHSATIVPSAIQLLAEQHSAHATDVSWGESSASRVDHCQPASPVSAASHSSARRMALSSRKLDDRQRGAQRRVNGGMRLGRKSRLGRSAAPRKLAGRHRWRSARPQRLRKGSARYTLFGQLVALARLFQEYLRLPRRLRVFGKRGVEFEPSGHCPGGTCMETGQPACCPCFRIID